ncbi:amphiphysin isoform X3 [Clupea harengus]|uniref:Amphiphysin isoform X3 n=1 Tax=Clupea harengus TaxID=7950 RepID=A0A6P8F3Z4_CLUHA|nr:amphiphysin isoform X3 [Clupea harengus]
MAEIKTGIFAKNVQKRLSRAQEKVLQKLGKADETKDEQFEQCVQNFKRQEFEGSRLQREMRTYLAAVKAMQQASMSLTESLHEVYEPDWHGRDDVMTIGKNCDELWEDFHERLVDSTVSALENYLTQFPDLKIRVSKRARKLIDYDSARHHLETMQVTNQSNQRKILKAEDDLKKAQKVFDDLNVGLQDELPTLWDSRVGFYVNTFKSVTSLEAKFHREISVLCHKLYEVMNKLAEQHSDKMFTIQGAPSDSGPLRLARTPTPPDDSDPDSPDATPNHMLRLASPGPPRPKSPSMSEDQKKGPPRPPKATPTKELMQEQIIDLFGGSFPMASSSSQPNEGPVESLLDLDFDPFPSSTPIGQSQSPMPQTLPWDMWTEEVPAAQPQVDSGSWASGAPSQGEGEREASVDANPSFSAFPAFPDQGGDTGFTVDWSANFSAPAPVTEGAAAADASVDASADAGADASADASVDASADASAFASTSADAAADAAPASDGWPPSSGWATEATQPQVETVGDEVRDQGPSEQTPEPNPQRDPCDVVRGQAEQEQEQEQVQEQEQEQELGQGQEGTGTGWAPEQAGWGWGEGEGQQEAAEGVVEELEGEAPVPGIVLIDEFGQEVQGGTKGGLGSQAAVEGSGSEYETAEEWGEAPGRNGGWVSADNELAATEEQGAAAEPMANQGAADSGTNQGGFADWGAGDAASPFPEQVPAADTSFGGEGFAVQWDQPAATELMPEEPTGVSVPAEQSAPEPPLSAPEPALDITEPAQGSDPFGTTEDPFGAENDPFGTEKDPFATSEDPFGTSETDPFGTSDKDPFANAEQDLFANQGADVFASQAPADAVGFASDPFGESSGQDSSANGGWAADPFATNTTQGWPGGWESTGGEEGKDSSQWPAFPDPSAAAAPEADSASKGSWQEVSNNAFNGFPQTDASASAPAFAADFDKMPEGVEGAAAPAAAEAPEAPEAPEAAAAAVGQVTEGAEGQVTTPPAPAEAAEASETTAASPPGEKAPTPAESPVSADNVEGAQSEIPKGDECEKEQPTQKAPESAPVPEAAKESPTAETPASAEDKGSPIEEAPAEVAKPEGESSGTEAQAQAEPGQEAGTVEAKAEAEAEEAASAAGAKPVEWAADSVSEEEKMPIPSVVIEPASSNEGDDDRDVDILSPATSDNGVAPIPDLSSGLPGMPPGFLYKVEAMHDFDAENTDELNLKMGDLVFVIPTKQTADQEAGWLTGIREADWLQQGASAKSGLFPDNFTTRVE